MTAVASLAITREHDRYTVPDGVELLGPYKNGGYSDTLFLVRRGDGRMLQLSRLPYLIVACFIGGAAIDLAARRVQRYSTDQLVESDDLRRFAADKLVPLGLLVPFAQSAMSTLSAAPEKVERRPGGGGPLLGLRFKVGAISSARANKIAACLRPLFFPPCVVAVLLAALGADIALVWSGAIGSLATDLVRQPGLLLVVYALLISSIGFHEMGHATACRYGGGSPGRIGFGVYLAWPVLFADVTESYRLDRRARLRTDLGGLYFNCVLLAAFGAVYLATHSPLATAGLLVQNVIILEQLLPVIRLDGYWVVSDLAGVPDLYRYVGPILSRLIPRRRPHPLVSRLTLRARVVISIWVAIAIPFLAINGTLILLHLVALVRAGSEITLLHLQLMAGTVTGHQPLMIGTIVLVEFVLVVIPMFGLPALVVALGRVLVVKLRRWTGVPTVVRLLAGVGVFGPAMTLVVVGWLR